MAAGLELTPIPLHERNSSTLDVALLFAGANVVSSTLITGATLGASTSWGRALTAMLLGLVLGTAPLAALARLGPRHGLPSMILLRAPFGVAGAALVSGLLIVTNFAWIALNNQVAARAFGALFGPSAGASTSAYSGALSAIFSSPATGSVVVGVLAIVVAALGPGAMARFDRIAVPLMALLAFGLTLALLRSSPIADAAPSSESTSAIAPLGVFASLDLVIGYQVSWSLMFADYTRYQRREAAASRAVFFGLTLTSAWLMGIGVVAATAVGSNDPTELILASGLPSVALLVLALATVTTNFVNLYLSALALRTLWPGFPPRLAVVLLGTVGTLLSVVDERLLERYAGFMGLLATLLLPIVAIALVHFFWLPRRRSGADRGALLNTTRPGMRPAGLAAWGAGALVYQVVVRTHPEWGATALTLIVAACVYAMFSRRATNPCKLGSSPGSSR